jgi:hypothetical protein
MAKKLFLIGLSLLIALPLLAKEIELTPTLLDYDNSDDKIIFPTENELSNDNGTTQYYWSGTGYGIFNTIEIPYDCYLIRIKDYIHGSGTGDVMVDVLEDSGGTPVYNSLISGPIPVTYSGSNGWHESDDFASPVFFTSGTVTHPGQDAGLPSAGTCTDTDTTGVGGCWYYSGGSFYDYTFFGHVMTRLIVNDDVDPPYVDQQDPPDGGQGEPDTVIEFHVKDDDIGVDTSTIAFSAEDESKGLSVDKIASSFIVKSSRGVVPGTFDFDDTDPNDVICTFTPDSDLPIGDNIFCVVDSGLADLLTNATVDDITWSFEVIPYNAIENTSLGNIKTMFE